MVARFTSKRVLIGPVVVVLVGAAVISVVVRANAGNPSGRADYLRAIDRLVHLPRFQIHEETMYLSDPSERLSYDLRSTSSGHLRYLRAASSPRYAGGMRSQPVYIRISVRQLKSIVGDMLVPQHATDFPFDIPRYPVRALQFSSTSKTTGTGRASHQLEVVTIKATGYPWICPPIRPCPPPRLNNFTYTGRLLVDRSTGLPLRYTSTGSAGRYAYPGQRVSFGYGARMALGRISSAHHRA